MALVLIYQILHFHLIKEVLPLVAIRLAIPAVIQPPQQAMLMVMA
jgi:hypothetical protein